MLRANFAFYAGQIIVRLAKDLVYFPIWWYSQGFWQLLKGLGQFLINRQKGLALAVWLKNLFVPMYGQRDIAGAAISFFIRLIQIIFRSLALIFWAAVCLAMAVLWLVLPLYVIYQLFWQLNLD